MNRQLVSLTFLGFLGGNRWQTCQPTGSYVMTRLQLQLTEFPSKCVGVDSTANNKA